MKNNFNFKLTAQEHSMGCAVACVASRVGVAYKKAIKLFENEKHAWTRGYYCSEIVYALAVAGYNYTFQIFNLAKHSKQIEKPGTIVFVEPCQKYPMGHFFLLSLKGWMNPWSNYPSMKPIIANYQKELPGEISYIVCE